MSIECSDISKESCITLLRKGQIIPSKKITSRESKKLQDVVALDYIMDFISVRTPKTTGTSPTLKAKGYGDKIILIKAGTGAGKSTTIPSELYKRFFHRQKKSIIVTQPRILNTIDIAMSLPEFSPFMEFGKNLGYQTGVITKRSREPGVLFVNIDTFSVIFRKLTPEQIMKRYQFILIDEIHIREKALDSLLFLVREFLKIHWEDLRCPLFIFMSATFIQKTFIDYFEVPIDNFIQVKGEAHVIKEFFPKYTPDDYIQYASDKVIEIHKENIFDLKDKIKDIIVFVGGLGDAKAIHDSVNRYNREVYSSEIKEKYYIVPIILTSASFRQGGKEYHKLYSNVKFIRLPISVGYGEKFVVPSRRVVISTNLAETGVTINTLKYCIDTGWVKEAEFNADIGVGMIIKKNVSQSSALQRKGRVGRKAVGYWYPCYTKEAYDGFDTDVFAKLIVDDITDLLMNIIVKDSGATFDGALDSETKAALGADTLSSTKEFTHIHLFQKHIFSDKTYYKLNIEKDINIRHFDFIESPSARSYIYSLEKLYVLGFIDSYCNPTILGVLSTYFRRLSMENIRMIMAGYTHGCNILDLVTISAVLSIGMVFGRKYKLREVIGKGAEASFYNRTIIADEFIDILFAWDEFMEIMSYSKGAVEKVHQWCDNNDIKYVNLMSAVSFRDEIIDSMLESGLNPFYNGLGMPKGTYNFSKIYKSNVKEGIDEVIKIKKAILSGYRLNLATWNERGRSYYLSYRNQKIFVRSPLTTYVPVAGKDVRGGPSSSPSMIPTNIIISSPMLNLTADKTMYELQSGGVISIMDGFVDIDMQFLYR